MGVAWAEDGPAAQMGLQSVVGTAQAINSPCARFLSCDPDLDPEFCRIVNDFGAHEAESCFASDRMAERAMPGNGQDPGYRCHAGLRTSRCRSSEGITSPRCCAASCCWNPPTEESFQQTQRGAGSLDYIDSIASIRLLARAGFDRLEIQQAIDLKEAFAEYLATSWRRLFREIQEGQRSAREAALVRMEFCKPVLDGSLSDREHLQVLLGRWSTRRTRPVLLVRFGPETAEERDSACWKCAPRLPPRHREIADDTRDVVLTICGRAASASVHAGPDTARPDVAG